MRKPEFVNIKHLYKKTRKGESSGSIMILFIVLLISYAGSSQTAPPPGAPVYREAGAYTDHVSITDYHGGPFKNVYSDVEGSPFFPDHYCRAVLVDKKGRTHSGVQARLDLVKKELVIIDPDGKEMILQDGQIKELTIKDTSSGVPQETLVRSGFPAINNNDTNTFYQVLADGPLQLLKSVTKEIREEKNIQSGEVRKVIITREEYYTFNNDGISKLKKDKDFIEGLMNDQLTKLRQYQKENKLGFRSEKDLIHLFTYYNSLKDKKPF